MRIYNVFDIKYYKMGETRLRMCRGDPQLRRQPGAFLAGAFFFSENIFLFQKTYFGCLIMNFANSGKTCRWFLAACKNLPVYIFEPLSSNSEQAPRTGVWIQCRRVCVSAGVRATENLHAHLVQICEIMEIGGLEQPTLQLLKLEGFT